MPNSDLIVLGNGWVARTCYRPGAVIAGFKRVHFTEPVAGDGRALSADEVRALLDKVPGAIIVVATPTFTHWPITKTALSADCTILCEKPLMLSQEADAVNASSYAFDRLYVSTPFAFREDVEYFKSTLSERSMGQVRRVRVVWERNKGVPRPGSWYTTQALSGGGVLADLGPHLLDIALDILGWPTINAVSCRCTHLPTHGDGLGSTWMSAQNDDFGVPDVEASVEAVFHTPDGQQIELLASWAAAVEKDHTTIEAEGDSGSLRLSTLFGYSPGRMVSRLSLDGPSSNRWDMPLRRDRGEDFGKMMVKLLQEQARPGRLGLQVVQAIADAYRIATWK